MKQVVSAAAVLVALTACAAQPASAPMANTSPVAAHASAVAAGASPSAEAQGPSAPAPVPSPPAATAAPSNFPSGDTAAPVLVDPQF